jgi:CheY-like chemotaxis protein
MTNEKDYLLIVEDVPDILELLEETLKFKGYRVMAASNGEEALKIIEMERPALIVTDILMPKMDGFTLVHRLRLSDNMRDIPVVFLSATYIAPEDKEFAHTIGVSRFIEKPVNWEEFFPLVDELMSGKSSEGGAVNEVEFYEGYRKRLEIKLKHKNIQITRDEHLLETLPEVQKPAIKTSLQNTLREKEEILAMLVQIREKLENLSDAD